MSSVHPLLVSGGHDGFLKGGSKGYVDGARGMSLTHPCKDADFSVHILKFLYYVKHPKGDRVFLVQDLPESVLYIMTARSDGLIPRFSWK